MRSERGSAARGGAGAEAWTRGCRRCRLSGCALAPRWLRAAMDEFRHAEMCMRMVEIYSGEQKLPPPGMSQLPDDPSRPKLHQALAHTMLVSCVSEAYATP